MLGWNFANFLLRRREALDNFHYIVERRVPAAKEGKNRFLILCFFYPWASIERAQWRNHFFIITSSLSSFVGACWNLLLLFRPSFFPSLTYSLVNLSLAPKKFHEFNIRHPYLPHSSSHQIEKKKERTEETPSLNRCEWDGWNGMWIGPRK